MAKSDLVQIKKHFIDQLLCTKAVLLNLLNFFQGAADAVGGCVEMTRRDNVATSSSSGGTLLPTTAKALRVRYISTFSEQFYRPEKQTLLPIITTPTFALVLPIEGW